MPAHIDKEPKLSYRVKHHNFCHQLLMSPTRKLFVVYALRRYHIEDTTTTNLGYNHGTVHAVFESNHLPDDRLFEGYELPTVNISEKVFNTWATNQNGEIK